jgi:hypothetical protein
MGVGTFFGTINFAIMLTNTFFLFCFANIKKHNVYLDNTRDVLVYNGKDYFIVMKNGYPLSVAKATVIVVTIGLLYVRTVKGSNDCRIVDA